MALVPRFLIPVCALAYLPLACSSTDDGAGPKPPAPPSGGNAAGGTPGTAGTATAGTATGGSGGSATGGGSGMACTTTTDCVGTGFVCRTNMCACTADIPDVCGTGADGACVNKKSDPDHCGDCATKCDAGATCVDSMCTKKPVELTKGTGCGAMRLAISGTNVYWTEATSGKVQSMPLAGGAPVEIATGQTAASEIVADATGVYWLAGGNVMKKALPFVAGVPDTLKNYTTLAATATPPAVADAKIIGLAVRAGKLYYSFGHDVHQISTDKAVTADIIVGTAVNYDAPPKIEGVPHGVAVNDTMIAWTDVGDRNGVEGDDILVESATPLTDKAGYVELAQSVGGLKSEIAVDAMYAYWVDGARFVRNKLSAVAPVPDPAIMESPKASEIGSFAITATNVYASNTNGLILRHSLIPPADGMEPVEAAAIARDQMTPTAVVTDGTKVYWATADCAIRSTDL